MKKKVRIHMIHPFVHNEESLYRLLHMHSVENLEYELEWDDCKPQYLIASEHIYSSRKAWDSFVKLYNLSKIKIFYAGECISPDLNIFDYAVCFDKNMYNEDRIGRMPTRLFYENLTFHRKNELEGDLSKAKEELELKKGFCNFIYSNAQGHIKRKELFDEISNYKKVDSLGNYLNNRVLPKNRKTISGWRPIIEECIDWKRNYKFSIACENASYRGYTSEKIISSMEAHTVPIYWGNPLIGNEFNEKAFVNCHKFDEIDALINKIREIDQDDSLWCTMVSQPWLTAEQEIYEKKDTEKYYNFINHIFSQPIETAKRIGEGFHPQNYLRWFFEY